MKHSYVLFGLSTLLLASCQGQGSLGGASYRQKTDDVKIVDLGHGFRREGDQVYYDSSPLPDVDAESFQILYQPMADWPIFKDKNHVYDFDFNPVQGADLDTYVVLGQGYAKDKNHVYFMGQPLEGADPESFMIVARDNEHVYWGSQEMPGLNLSSFQQISSRYYRDDDSVYHMFYYECYYSCPPMKIEGADPDSFEEMDSYFARDKSRVYLLGKPVDGVDRGSFEIVKSDYDQFYFVGKDKDHVFISHTPDGPMPELQVWEGVDSATFEIIDEQTARDAHGTYSLPSGEKL